MPANKKTPDENFFHQVSVPYIKNSVLQLSLKGQHRSDRLTAQQIYTSDSLFKKAAAAGRIQYSDFTLLPEINRLIILKLRKKAVFFKPLLDNIKHILAFGGNRMIMVIGRDVL